MKNFAEKFLALAKERTSFCLGIDPTPALLRDWNLPDSTEGLNQMCKIIVEATPDLAIVKPQIAYFERFGALGVQILISLIGQFHDRGTLVLIDAKRGDIGSTVKAYAESIMGPESALKADAVTVHAYLGFESLIPLFLHAQKTGTGVFVVVKSSNPEGKIVQDAVIYDGRTVAEYLADSITTFNSNIENGAAIGPIGAVIGATIKDDSQPLLKRLDKSLILAPGIGFQGASFDDLTANFSDVILRVIPSSSRSVLKSGPGIEALREQIKKHCVEARLITSSVSERNFVLSGATENS